MNGIGERQRPEVCYQEIVRSAVNTLVSRRHEGVAMERN